MTLITYLTRVHFADGVLEEALHAEMEQNAKRRPLIIAGRGSIDGTFGERIFSGLPARTVAATYSGLPTRPTEAAVEEIARTYRDEGCDLLIAFGGNLAIDLAKLARIAIAFDEPIAALSEEQGGSQLISGPLPDLYSIPGILGFASAISEYARVRLTSGGQALLSSRRLIPTVTICDPTLTLGATHRESAMALAGIVSRGVEVVLSSRYNPPADALALDSLSRLPPIIDKIAESDDIAAHRELMAAGLNSGLAMQKGLCAQHALANALASASQAIMEPISIGPVLVPELVRHYGALANGRGERIKDSLGLNRNDGLSEGLHAFFGRLPIAGRLSDLMICAADLPEAAKIASGDRAIRSAPRAFTDTELLEILQAVH